MTRKELDLLKEKVLARREKAEDLDVVVSEIMELPYGQVKKLMTEEVLAVLEKYGYTEYLV